MRDVEIPADTLVAVKVPTPAKQGLVELCDALVQMYGPDMIMLRKDGYLIFRLMRPGEEVYSLTPADM